MREVQDRDGYVVFLPGPVLDEYYETDVWPAAGDKVRCRYVGRFCGGMIANAACVCAGLGVRASCFDAVSSDADGEWVLKELAAHGVDVSHVVRIDQRHDARTLILLSQGERNVFICEGRSPHELSLTEAQLDYLRRAEYLYSELLFEHLIPDECGFLKFLWESGVKIVFDVEATSYCPNWRAYIRWANTVFINEFGVEKFREGHTVEEFAGELFGFGVERLVITLGGAGCRVLTAREDFTQRGYRVDAVDTTGAGDTFNAAFLACIKRGMSDRDAARYANAAGAMCVMGFGPQAGITTFEKIEQFMLDQGT